MRYRKLSPTGDFVFGHGSADYYINSSQAVAQAIVTALKLIRGEWFLDKTAGVPYFTQVLGYNTQSLYDVVFRSVINGVEGVLEILNYSSNLSPSRLLTISATVSTVFGITTINSQVPLPTLPTGYGVGPYGVGGFGI